MDFTIPTREVPISHPGAQAPLCDEVTPFCTHVALYLLGLGRVFIYYVERFRICTWLWLKYLNGQLLCKYPK